MGGRQIPGQQFGDSVDRQFRDARQDGAQIEGRIEAVQLCGFHEAVEHGGPLPTGIRPQKQIILPTHRDGAFIVPLLLKY
jgi:hypothetical protein